jgi:hypothetical protein
MNTDTAPMTPEEKERRLMSFAGIGEGTWGSTPEEVQKTIRDLRASWERTKPKPENYEGGLVCS